ncbi:MAG: hypothetical protein DHS80DRAFT_21500 [Piptocephalis tieghemiana]|nr:MAG: hypothetical protein DHS80DRAFT_21500 [Piptocephalis tieghemiana]
MDLANILVASCNICMEALSSGPTDNSPITSGLCGHVFHKHWQVAFVSQWTQARSEHRPSCPNCRQRWTKSINMFLNYTSPFSKSNGGLEEALHDLQEEHRKVQAQLEEYESSGMLQAFEDLEKLQSKYRSMKKDLKALVGKEKELVDKYRRENESLVRIKSMITLIESDWGEQTSVAEAMAEYDQLDQLSRRGFTVALMRRFKQLHMQKELESEAKLQRALSSHNQVQEEAHRQVTMWKGRDKKWKEAETKWKEREIKLKEREERWREREKKWKERWRRRGLKTQGEEEEDGVGSETEEVSKNLTVTEALAQETTLPTLDLRRNWRGTRSSVIQRPEPYPTSASRVSSVGSSVSRSVSKGVSRGSMGLLGPSEENTRYVPDGLGGMVKRPVHTLLTTKGSSSSPKPSSIFTSGQLDRPKSGVRENLRKRLQDSPSHTPEELQMILKALRTEKGKGDEGEGVIYLILSDEFIVHITS